MVESTEKGNNPPITIRLAFHGEYIPTHFTDSPVEETKSENDQTSPNIGKKTSSDICEYFDGIDISKTTLHNLITELYNRRDFSENAIKKMIVESKVKHGEIKGKPKVIILLYPEHRDLDSTTEPLYVSTATGAG